MSVSETCQLSSIVSTFFSTLNIQQDQKRPEYKPSIISTLNLMAVFTLITASTPTKTFHSFAINKCLENQNNLPPQCNRIQQYPYPTTRRKDSINRITSLRYT